jgi:hypothetical protein
MILSKILIQRKREINDFEKFIEDIFKGIENILQNIKERDISEEVPNCKQSILNLIILNLFELTQSYIEKLINTENLADLVKVDFIEIDDGIGKLTERINKLANSEIIDTELVFEEVKIDPIGNNDDSTT